MSVFTLPSRHHVLSQPNLVHKAYVATVYSTCTTPPVGKHPAHCVVVAVVVMMMDYHRRTWCQGLVRP